MVLKNILFKTLKIFIALICILIITYYNLMLITLNDGFKVQICFYHLISLILVFCFIFFSILKNKKFNLCLTVLFIFWLFMPKFLVDVSFLFAKDSCLDSGYCKEGLKINTQFGPIEINKQNCSKYHWQWIEENKACKVH